MEEPSGLQPGDQIVARQGQSLLRVGPGLLGRVLDGLGRPLDGGRPIDAEDHYNLYTTPPNPLSRNAITQPITTGVRAIDGFYLAARASAWAYSAEAASAPGRSDPSAFD
jgi:flagellar biosynthesis/type III secretory pathway ATPase